MLVWSQSIYIFIKHTLNIRERLESTRVIIRKTPFTLRHKGSFPEFEDDIENGNSTPAQIVPLNF